MTKKLGDDFYKAKGVVKSMLNNYTANVKIDDFDGKGKGLLKLYPVILFQR